MRRQRATDPASERGIQQAILDLLTAERVFAIRLNTCTVMVEGKDGHKFPVRSHYGGAGVPDILAFLSSSGAVVGSTMRAQWVLWIEVKRPGKKQSPEQVSFEKRITGDGHCYLTASSTDDVLVMLKALRAVTQ